MSSIPWRTGRGYHRRYPDGPRQGQKIRKPIAWKPREPVFPAPNGESFQIPGVLCAGPYIPNYRIWLAKQSPKRILTKSSVVPCLFGINWNDMFALWTFSLVMRPHPNDLYRLDVIQNLVDQAMLYIDPTGACPGKVSNELFVNWRCLIGVFFEKVEDSFGLRLQTGSGQFLCISFSVLGKHQPPAHQSSSSSHSPTGVFSPSRMDSRMPGMDVRYKVS